MISQQQLILMIIVLGLLSIVSRFQYTEMNSYRVLKNTYEDVKQIEDWKNAIEKSLLVKNNTEIVAPLGINQGNYMTLPDLLEGRGLKKKNSLGEYLIYCPLSGKANGIGFDAVTAKQVNDGIVSGVLQSYDVNTLPLGTSQREYVTANDNFIFKNDVSDQLLNAGILAIIISPSSKEQTISCEDLTLNWKILNDFSLVKVITTKNITHPLTMIEKIDSGDSVTKDLADLFLSYNVLQPDRYKVSLLESVGALSLSQDLLITNDYSNEYKTITIEGSGDLTSINSGTLKTITFKNVHLLLNNVSIGSQINIVINGGSLTVKNNTKVNNITLKNNAFFKNEGTALINKLTANNASLQLNSGLILSSLVLKNSTATQLGNIILKDDLTDSKSALVLLNSQYFQQANLTVESNSAATSSNIYSIFVSEGSDLYIDGSNITSSISYLGGSIGDPNALLQASGSLHIKNSLINTSGNNSAVISLKEGSRLSIDSTQINTAGNIQTDTVIFDGGAIVVKGNSSHFYGNSCWNNDGLFFASTFTDSSVSILDTDYKKSLALLNKSKWLCN